MCCRVVAQRRALDRWHQIRRQIDRRVSLLSGSLLDVNQYEDQRLGVALANKIVGVLRPLSHDDVVQGLQSRVLTLSCLVPPPLSFVFSFGLVPRSRSAS